MDTLVSGCDGGIRGGNSPLIYNMVGGGKSQSLSDGSCVLRTIIRLIPHNDVMDNGHCAWFIRDHGGGTNEQVTFHQSNMSAAFYLFEMPSVRRKWTCFDISPGSTRHAVTGSILATSSQK